MSDPSQVLLVLGGSGFLGSHVLRRASRHWPGRIASASRRPSAHRLAGTPPAVEARVFDAERDAPEELLDALAPTHVVLTTAHSRVDACEREPERARCLNVELPARVARWCAGRARLAHVSTDLVFDGAAPAGGYPEEHAPGPRHVYGASKAAGEERVLAADPAALVVRLPLLYGDSCGRALGASDVLRTARARGERPGLFLDEWRTPLEAENAADALLEAALDERLTGLLHVAGPERLSRLELGLRLLVAMGLDPPAARAAVRAVHRADVGMADRPADCALAIARARAALTTPLEPPGARPLAPVAT